MSKQGFQKFIQTEKTGAAKKEAFRQAKRADKAARRTAFQDKKIKLQARAANPISITIKQEKTASGKTKLLTSAKSDAPIAEKTWQGEMPLNKYLAYCGVCGRREAVDIIKAGSVKVNEKIVITPSFKVIPSDIVWLNNKRLFIQKNLVYILLNKPKDYITTVKDPEGRKTVLELIKTATTDRVYPVGRLDRNTTGVLLLTNDGELAQKLTHPSYEIKKIYEVKLDKPVTKKDMESIASGITLEDGFIRADAVAYADAKDKSIVGIEIHSGKNRIVRRMFESLGYDVRGLDRVLFANLTKKNVDRGKWRLLNEKEIRALKFLNKSFVKKTANENPESIDKKPFTKKAATSSRISLKPKSNRAER